MHLTIELIFTSLALFKFADEFLQKVLTDLFFIRSTFYLTLILYDLRMFPYYIKHFNYIKFPINNKINLLQSLFPKYSVVW